MKIIIKKVSAVILLLATTLSIMVDGTFIPNNVVQASETAQKELDDWIDSGKSKTYNIYDVTGDGKSDTLKIKVAQNGVTIFVNGKKAYSRKNGDLNSIDVSLYKIENEVPILAINAGMDSSSYGVVLRYASGKLVKQFDLEDEKGFAFGRELRVASDKITAYFLRTYCVGTVYFAYTYTYKNGKWNCSKYGDYYLGEVGKKNIKVLKNFTTYKEPGLKSKAFTVKKGSSVKILKCRLYKDNMHIKLECKGKKGWIKDYGYDSEMFDGNFFG